MRISDWSSDVCSSDLLEDVAAGDHDVRRGAALLRLLDQPLHLHQRAVARTGIDDAVFVGLVVGHFEPAHHVAADPVIRLYHRSEEHTSELQSLMRISYAVFCLKKKNKILT